MSTFFKQTLFLSTLGYTDVDFPIGLILFAVTLGLVGAVIAAYFTKRSMHLLVKRLLRYKAVGEQNARTAEELKLSGNPFVKYLLCGGGKLKTLVMKVGEAELSYEEYIAKEKEKKKNKKRVREADPEPPRYYIPEKSAQAAQRVYEEGAPSPLSLILSLAALLGIYALLVWALPDILTFLFV